MKISEKIERALSEHDSPTEGKKKNYYSFEYFPPKTD
jgi:hypothetical protein